MLDPLGRQINYLRLSVTDRCNLRCIYCMAEEMTFLPREHILSLEELYEVSAAFVELGVKKIRITGGEPLVRNNIDTLINNLGQLYSLDELTMTTNGTLLEKYLPAMLTAGIKRINVSLDTTDKTVFTKLTRFDQLDNAIKGLDAAKQAGLKVRLNSVILKDKNENNILPLVDFAVEQNFDIAFIEEMPLGQIDSHQRTDTITFNNIVQSTIEKRYKLESAQPAKPTAGPARYLSIQNSDTKVGFISPHSNNFCHTCNRVRVTAEGKLLLCLGHDNAVDLRAVLRAKHYHREKLKECITNALQHKPKEHEFSTSETHVMRFMNMTGG